MYSLTETSQQAYCAAVSLNNAGVSMLERGCLQQAHRTFQSATVILKEVCRPSFSSHQADALLKLAYERLAHPEPTMLSTKVRVLSCDPTMPPSASMLASLAPHDSSIMTPVKIDVLDMDHAASSGPNIESSIIIYNCGVISYYMAQTKPQGPNYQALLLNSYKFFHLSAQVSSSIRRPEDEVTTACHLVLAFLAFRSLLQVVDMAGEEARLAMDCPIDYFCRLHDDIYSELLLWQSGTTLMLLLMDPLVAAMA